MAVGELAADVRRHAREVAAAQLARLVALDQQRERALEDGVDLLLALVGVDAAALAGPQADQVQPEGADAELLADALEAIVAVWVDRGERDAGCP